MKIYFARFIAASLIFCIACSKDDKAVMTPSPSQTDLLSKISNSWELYMYNVRTEKEKYFYTGPEIKSHSLRKLIFNRAGIYISANNAWSGTYQFLNDSTQLILTPADTYLFPCILNIDNISPAQMQVSSPWVEVNPEKTGATDYERFIAYEGLKFLFNRGMDISILKSVKLELRYFTK